MSVVQPTDDDLPASPPHEMMASPTASPTSAIVRYGERGHSRTNSWGSVRTTHTSKHFPNGDTYVGEVAAGVPHGKGKYTWKDGSSYDGDWSEGKKHGRGVFHWPSNASYDGDWMGGNMEGWGTYRSPNGESYRGSWHLNQKHGLGKKKYANGDVYDGLWQNGAFEGPGRYIWANGNSYSGNWRVGKMDGKGIFVWANRDRYDGEWCKGKEHGKGVFTWADGSVFEGSWLQGLRHGRGVYYPPGVKPGLRSRKGSRRDLATLDQTPPTSGELSARASSAADEAGPVNSPQEREPGQGGGASEGQQGERQSEDSKRQPAEGNGGVTGKARNAKVTSFSDWNVEVKVPPKRTSSGQEEAGLAGSSSIGRQESDQSPAILEDESPDKTVISSPPPLTHRRSVSADGDSFTFRREGPEQPIANDGRNISVVSPFGSRSSHLGLTYDSDTTLSESSFGESQSGASTPVAFSPVAARSRIANGNPAQRPPVPRPSNFDPLARDLFNGGVQNGKTVENGTGHMTPEEDADRKRTSSGEQAGHAARRSVDATLSRSFKNPLASLDISVHQKAMIREYVEGKLVSEEEQAELPEVETPTPRARRHSRRGAKEVKRPGETIFKGHRSYDLMLNLQTGIRYTVGKITPEKIRELRSSDFRAKMSQRFPPNGSSTTPPHRSHDFKWKDYCPMVFRHLRELFSTDAADYMMSLTGNDALRELSSPGKSGSVFYLSHDDRFLIKTMRKGEMQVLLKMLPAYYAHVRKYENTLLTKFYGLHRIKPAQGRKVRFMVMGNMFHTDLRIDRRFDLKGSSQGRFTDRKDLDASTTLKDLDLDLLFKLEEGWRERLCRQLGHDCELLQQLHIMDYSLLLGVHYRDIRNPNDGPQGSVITEESYGAVSSMTIDDGEEEVSTSVAGGGTFRRLGTRGTAPRLPYGMNGHMIAAMAPDRTDTLRPVLGSRGGTDALAYSFGRSRVQLGVNMAATALPKNAVPDSQLAWSQAKDVVLYFGIIDILQEWDVSKRVEHTYKSIKFRDSQSMSAVDPKTYSQRFQDYIGTLFL